MAKSPKKPESKKPNRTGKAINVWLPEGIHDALNAFIKAQRVPPSTTDTVELAIQEFLIREGFPPVKKSD